MAKVTDRIRLEVLKNALEGIADGMALTLIRTSRSSVVRSGLDFSTGVLSANGDLIGQGACQPMHLGGMMPALQSCIKRYKGNINPGDIFITNDPYEGGSHLPDIFQYKPLFIGDKLIGFACAMTHHTDIGGRVAGGNACDSTEIYQEGLRIPPLKLYEAGEPNETMFRIIEKAVRVPDKVMGDILGQVAAMNYGEQEYMKLINRYGIEGLDAHTEEMLDYTEELTRNTIRSWPDGEWSFTDYVDDDGITPDPIAIAVKITKKGDELHFDFDGTSPQCKGAIQPVFPTTKAMVYAVLKCVMGVMGADVPNSSGYFRPVTVTAPEGTFVNPMPPAPVAARSLGAMRIAQVVFGAFGKMLPDSIFACAGGCELGVGMAGDDKSKTPWKPWVQLEFYNEQAGGGWPDHDGYDAQNAGMMNMSNIPSEQLEAEQPILVEEYGFTLDSEGAGKFRGGMGQTRTYRYLMDDTIVQMRADRKKFQPYGVNGGQSPNPTRITLNPSNENKDMPPKFLIDVNKGDVVKIQWPGAGGDGNPLHRAPDMVLQDVIAEKVSIDRAKDTYGVVIDLDSKTVDAGATETLRAKMAK